eukprot:SAG11_NODE_1363_length_5110_cov_7.005588_2_plen_131_part_00
MLVLLLPTLLVAAAEVVAALPAAPRNRTNVGVVNGRPVLAGEWDGVVMVVTGSCEEPAAGLCSGVFIHPEIVLTAGHCCAEGDHKAVCGGKVAPGRQLSVANQSFTDLGVESEQPQSGLDIPAKLQIVQG